MPLQDPPGGPNFFMFDDKALYEIHIDNNGDAKEDISFKFQFKNTSKGTALTVGGKQTKIPLINSGVISGVNPATLNVRETFSVEVSRDGRRKAASGKLSNVTGGATEFDKPVDNIGDKTFGSATGYATYANLHIYDVTIPGCANGRMFVGQRKEPFYIAVGKILDRINLDPLGPEVGGNANNLEDKSVTTIALEVPIACLAPNAAADPVIGAWTTASKRQATLLNPAPGVGLGKGSSGGGAWAQVSRLR